MADVKDPSVVININLGGGTVQVATTRTEPDPDLTLSRSPAWHPNAHELGGRWAEVHAADTNPEVRLQLRKIYHGLFTSSVDLTSDQQPYPVLQGLQQNLAQIDPDNPAKRLTAANPMSDLAGNPLVDMTVVEGLNRFLAPLNDNTPAPFSHAQYVLLWHVFRDQDDLKLLSPWLPPGEGFRPW